MSLVLPFWCPKIVWILVKSPFGVPSFSQHLCVSLWLFLILDVALFNISLSFSYIWFHIDAPCWANSLNACDGNINGSDWFGFLPPLSLVLVFSTPITNWFLLLVTTSRSHCWSPLRIDVLVFNISSLLFVGNGGGKEVSGVWYCVESPCPYSADLSC